MKCNDALDTAYKAEVPLPFGKRLLLAFHIITCGQCSAHLENYERARFLLRTDFFPSSPDFSDSIMNSIYQEAEADISAFGEEAEEHFFGVGGFSVKGWVIAGIVLLLSLATVFFGQDFTSIALDEGSSFLLPLGIITGIVITGYGALFIGSHLKEFSERFKL
ncbi:MAG: peptidoglycan-binding protein [Treponema sp.]|nr:peptidoglycan-binding protein [Treponema sp.]